jgi:retinoblastoma-like protein 1
VFACCVEIVLFSYNSNQCFPWIIQVLNIQSYNFYKVIEVIVKEEPGLSRGVVKHLNQIEESILDSMAWKSGSLLFDVLETVDYNVPKYEDVQGTALQSQACASVTSQVSVTPVPALARSAAASQFSSSMVARRQLGLPMSVPTSPAVALPVPPEKGKGMAKQKQSRSLNLFFRKVYHLAYVRMAHLCDRLEISADQIQKTWTCFEHSLVKHTSLMRDHHLDQLIMCAIYVIGKVAHNELQFQKIMEHYRYQPQSRNHVYRSVLLSVRGSGKGKGKSGASEVEAKVSPQRGGDNSTSPSRNTRRSARRQKLSMATAAASQSDTPPVDTGSGDKVISSTSGSQSDEERGDIIKFYNQIYIYRVKDFALQYSSEDSSGLVSPLSPLPVLKHQHQSPKRRVSAHHSLYLSPQQPVAPTSSLTPQTRRLYCFSRSPAKILQEINKVVQDHKPSGSKRSLSFPEAGSPAKRTPTASPLFNNTLRSLSQDREDASNNGSFTS